MPADTFSSFLGFTLQGTGNNNNSWGSILNGSGLQTLEKAIAGNTSHAVTGGTLDLSGSPPPAAQTQVLEMLQAFTGTLTSNQLVKLPNVSKFWAISNQTAGAFQLLFQIGAGTVINVPQGTTKFVVCDGAGSLIRMDKDQVGNFEYNNVVSPGTLEANGASLLRADFPDLFAKYGTTYGAVDGIHFTLPLLTDTGRFLRSRSGSLTAGTYQSNQNLAHTHTMSGAPAVGSLTTDSQGSHTHTATSTDAGHTHSYTQRSGILHQDGTQSATVATQDIGSTTGVGFASITTSIAAAGAHTHTVTGTLTAGTLAASSSGGSEARPEALAVIISIRY